MPPYRDSNKSTGNQNIFVAVRCRPMNASEIADRSYSVVETDQDKQSISVRERPQVGAPSKTFTYDRVFGTNSRQIDVYKAVVEPAIDEVIMGYNCTIFAYGQTGTGKTFTMEGERSAEHLRWEDDPMAGIIPRCLAHLFERLESSDCEFSMRVSYLELYNEELFDLLGPSECETKMRIYEDSNKKGSVFIQGLEEAVVRNKHEVYDILKKGSLRRQTASTMMNATSSRSHTVFTVTIHTKENSVDGEELVKTGKLNLVDLAGSENIGRSGAVDRRAREAGNINQSLLTLGRVITALVDRKPHIPYRESKLTRILQDSLGGKTKTSIIATISPANSNLEETLSTLDYAHRAKNIQNKPEINQKLTKKNLIKEFNEEIERLRRDLQASRDKNGIFINEENYKEMQFQLASQATLLKELEDKLSSLQHEKDALAEEHATTVTSLEDTRGKLADTSHQLEVTEKALDQSQAKLTRTIQQRDEQSHLVQKHVVQEGQLHGEGNRLLDSVKLTTDHITKLQTSNTTRTDIMHNNLSTLSAYQSSFTQNIDSLTADLGRFVSDQSVHQTSTQAVIERISKSAEQLVEREGSGLSALEQMVGQVYESLLTRMQDITSQTASTTDDVISSCKSTQENVKEIMQKWRDGVLADTLSQLAASLQSQGARVNALKDECLSLCDKTSTYNEQLSTSVVQCVEQSIAHMKQYFTAYKTHTDASTALLREDGELKAQKAKMRNKALAEVIALLEAERDKNAVDETEALTTAESYQRCLGTFDDALNVLEEKQTDSHTALNSHIANFTSHMTSAKEEALSSAASAAALYAGTENTISTHREQLYEQALSAICTSQEEMEAHVTSASVSMRKLAATIVSTNDSTKAYVQDSLEIVNKEVKSLTAGVNTYEQHQANQVRAIQEVLALQASELKQYRVKTESSHDTHKGDLSHLVDTQIQRYQPSGSTPPKMNYAHVEEVSKPLEHQQLLLQFRTDKAEKLEDMHANLAMPLSDSDEDVQDGLGDAENQLVDEIAVEDEDGGDSTLSSISSSSTLSSADVKENIPEAEAAAACGVSRRRKGIPRGKAVSKPASDQKGFKRPVTPPGKNKAASNTLRQPATKLVKRKLPVQSPGNNKKLSKPSN